MQIVGEIPFIKPQNELKQQTNGQKRWKIKKKLKKDTLFVFGSCFRTLAVILFQTFEYMKLCEGQSVIIVMDTKSA